jgi:hypothetical protein
MKEKPTVAANQTPVGGDLAGRIEMAIKKSNETNRGFFIVSLQIENLDQFRKRRPAHVVNGLIRELFAAVRQAVHTSQHVSIYRNGLGLVFDAADTGQVDMISRRLAALTQHVIRQGKYNDLTSRWSDIIYQFLMPNNPGILFARAGWAIYPRDGSTPAALLNRAHVHAVELAK